MDMLDTWQYTGLAVAKGMRTVAESSSS